MVGTDSELIREKFIWTSDTWDYYIAMEI